MSTNPVDVQHMARHMMNVESWPTFVKCVKVCQEKQASMNLRSRLGHRVQQDEDTNWKKNACNRHNITAHTSPKKKKQYATWINEVVFLWNRTLVVVVNKLSSTTVDFIRSEGTEKLCLIFSSPSDLMKSTVVDGNLCTTTTRVLFQRKTTPLLQETTEWEIYTK